LRLRTVFFPFEVLASAALPDKTVIAIAGNALASAVDAVPRLDIGDQGTIVMADDAGAVMASAPTRSLWQTDTVSLRMRMEVSWGLRAAAGLAWTQNVVW
jgi:hypothetical protein